MLRMLPPASPDPMRRDPADLGRTHGVDGGDVESRVALLAQRQRHPEQERGRLMAEYGVRGEAQPQHSTPGVEVGRVVFQSPHPVKRTREVVSAESTASHPGGNSVGNDEGGRHPVGQRSRR